MKNKIFDNFALKLLAVFCAVLLWLVVLNISDYVITVEIHDIPVEQLNGDVLDELDQIYDVEKGDTVDILVKGRRSIVDRLEASDFVATADLSMMSITNTVQIFVEPKRQDLKSDITITCVDNTMSLSLEEKVTVQFPVRINVKGTARDGYANVATSASPNLITIVGPKSAIGKVTDIVVDIDISGHSESFETLSRVYMMDAYGEVFENDKITLSDTEIKVSALIYPTKSVDVSVVVAGKPEDGYAVDEVHYQPQTVLIAGLPANIENVNEIQIRDISVNGHTENLQTNVDLTNYLPKDVYLAQSSSEIAVTVTIEKLMSKVVTVTAKDISMTNKKTGYTYSVTLSDDFKLNVTGLPKDLDTITITDINPVIDCLTLNDGDNNNVEITFADLDGVKYTVTGTVSVLAKNVKGN